MHLSIYLSSKLTHLGCWMSSILLASCFGSHWQCPIPNQRDPARRLTNMHDFCPPLIECWTFFFFFSLDSQWVWHHVPCLDILGRGSCCLANLPHWTGKMGSNERWDRKVSFVGLILVNVKWNSYPGFSLSLRRSLSLSQRKISWKTSGTRVWNSWHLPINEFSSKHLSTPFEFLSLLTTNWK